MITDIVLCLFFCFLAVFCSFRFFDCKLAHIEPTNEPVNVTAEVRSVKYSASYLSVYTIRVTEADGEKQNYNATVEFPYNAGLTVGDRIETAAVIQPFLYSEYDETQRNALYAEGIFAAMNAEICTKVGRCDCAPWFLLHKLRSAITARIDKADYPTAAPLLKALLLGDRSDLSGKAEMDFNRLGIRHLLAVSGTHFSVLLGLTALLLSLFGLNKRVVCALLIPVAIGYTALTGFSPSVCRAGIMALLCYIGFLLGRTRDAYTALFTAAAILLIVRPHLVFSISLWLSFLATFAILVTVELLGTSLWKKGKNAFSKLCIYLLSHLLITFAVTFITLPITATVFGEISTVSPIANLIFVPLFEVFLYLAPFSVLFPAFQPVTGLTEAFGRFLTEAVEDAAAPSGILISVRADFIPWISGFCIAATLILLTVRLKHQFWIAVPFCVGTAALVVCTSLFFSQQSTHTTVTYCTYTNNDAVLLVDRNRAMLIDVSSGGAAVSDLAIARAKENHCTEFSAYVLTHYHDRHISLMRRIFESAYVRRLYLPEPRTEEDFDTAYAITELAQTYGVPVSVIYSDTPIEFESCTVTLFEPQKISRSPHGILSFRIDDGSKQLLYLGSAFSEAKTKPEDSIAEAEYILFGQHTPIAKKRFSLTTNAKLIFGDNESSDLYDFTAASQEAYRVSENGYCEIQLK